MCVSNCHFLFETEGNRCAVDFEETPAEKKMSIPPKPNVLATTSPTGGPHPTIAMTTATPSAAKPNIPNIPNLPHIPNIPTIPPMGPNHAGGNAMADNQPQGSLGPGQGGKAEVNGMPQMNGMGMPAMMPMALPTMNMNIPMNMQVPLGMGMQMPLVSNMTTNGAAATGSTGVMANATIPVQGHLSGGNSSDTNQFDPAIVMKQNQLIQQVNNKAQSRQHFSFETFLNKEYNLGLDPDRPTCEYWIHSNGTNCPLGSECPLKHPAKGFRNKIVCKYWLRGLCKMGDNCDFLHEYNLSRMPECAYYTANGVCSQSPECVYLHVDPQSKIPECWNYTNMGFCPDGPNCTKRHIKRVLCERYLTGFCPKGKDCESPHPQFKLGLLHGRFKIMSDEEIIQKRLKDKADYDAKLKLEKDLRGNKEGTKNEQDKSNSEEDEKMEQDGNTGAAGENGAVKDGPMVQNKQSIVA